MSLTFTGKKQGMTTAFDEKGKLFACTVLSMEPNSIVQIKKVENTGIVQKTLTIYSPANGVIIKKIAFQGHHVKAGEHLYEIADLSKVWVDVDIYEYELPWIKKGMSAEMELTYSTLPVRSLPVKYCMYIRFLQQKPERPDSDWNFPIPIIS